MNRLKSAAWPSFRILGHLDVILDPSWLIVLPVGGWAVVTLYIPILGSFLDGWQAALVVLLIVGLVGLSLWGHVLAHAWAARGIASELPDRLSLFLFGDTAQVWPAASTPERELFAAIAGPLFNLFLAGLAYLIWNAQLTPVFNLSLLVTCTFNLWLVAINLIPAFPFDGGRAARAFIWMVAERAAAGRLAERIGVLVALLLAGWAVFLWLQHSRYSLETAGVTLGFALLMLVGLKSQKAWQWDRPSPAGRGLGRSLIAAMLLLILGLAPASLVLSNDGIEAPGFALSVEPMVDVAAPHRYAHAGTFILTSVVSQTPITAGEWALAKVDPAVRLVPPASVVPDNTTPQMLAREGFRQLDESTATAVVVGLRQAGYPAQLVGKGAAVVSILPTSPALGQLQPGDVITALNGNAVTTTTSLIQAVQALSPQSPAQLTVSRGQQALAIALPLMAPDASNAQPHLGIVIESAGADVQLPFPVKITPQKIVGGPSAGLMFTLAVYNLVSPADLTGGRKIAGTGTISLDGTVGPIGGVEQKVAAAEGAGAVYFLAPADNYAAALAVARRIHVVKVSTVTDAIAFLKSLPPQ